MGKLQDTIDAHRAALDARLAEATGPVVQAYGSAWGRIEAEVNRLTDELEELRASGAEVRPGRIARLERLRDLKRQVAEQLAELSQFALEEVQEAQRDVALAAGEHLRELTRAALGREPAGGRAAIAAQWNRLPDVAVERLVGALVDGSPLADLMVEVAGDGAKGFAEALTSGLIQGLNPRAVAAGARRALGLPLARTLTITRTESLRAYREATRAELMANEDVVTGWTWHAALDGRTCPCCWAMHGTVHDADERLDGHPNCRCAMVPNTKSWEELGFEGIKDSRPVIKTGEEEFDEQPDKVKLEVLGKEGLRRYKLGELRLTDLLARRANPEWGTMRYARSLKQVDAGGGGDWTGAAVQRDQKLESDFSQ